MGKQRKGEKPKRSKTNPRFTHCPKCGTEYDEWNQSGWAEKSYCKKCGKGFGQPTVSKVEPSWGKYPWGFEYAVQLTGKGLKRLRENRGN